jgi:hypothetical protein
MKRLIPLVLLPAVLLSGCSSVAAPIIPITSLDHDQLVDTSEYKTWFAADVCAADNLNEVTSLSYLPVKESASASPSIVEIVKSRTKRMKGSISSTAQSLKMLQEVSTWDNFTTEENEDFDQIWQSPSSVLDIWEDNRFKKALTALKDEQSLDTYNNSSFKSAVIEVVRKDWDAKCDNEGMLRETREILNDYESSLEKLKSKVVADFKKQGYKEFFDTTLVKRVGERTYEGEPVLEYSVLQFNYCSTDEGKRVFRFDFDAPGVFVNADGIKEDVYNGAARQKESEDYEGSGWDYTTLGVVSDFVFSINPVKDTYWKTNDFSGLNLTSTTCS